MAELAGQRYLGTQALGTVVAGQPAATPRELVIVAVDRWESGVVLRGTATVDRDDPFWLPRRWQLATDVGTEHGNGGGGGTSIGWSQDFEPPLPMSARELRITLGPDSERFRDAHPAGDSRTVAVALPAGPPTVHRASTTLDTAAEVAEFHGRTPSLEGGSVRPDGIVAVSARLEGADVLAGRDLVVTSIERFPHWFLLHVGGTGGLPALEPSRSTRRFRKLWTIDDDRGRRYEGAVRSSHSGFPWLVTAGFSPALDPAATELALAFPNPFGPGVVRTRLSLGPPARGSVRGGRGSPG